MTTKTYHGCTCLKDWVKIDGKKYSGCVYGDATDPKCPMTTDKQYAQKNYKCSSFVGEISSCPVEEGCGEHDLYDDNTDWYEKAKKGGVLKDTKFWDICEPADRASFGRPNDPSAYFRLSRSANIKAIIGLILFLAFAGFIIPHVLYRMGHHTLVNVWIPNLDLIASVFAFRGGLFNSTLFRFLYSSIPDTFFGFWSQLIIDYFALLGLTLITAHMVYRRKSISGGMSYALIMLIFSYLMPNTMIETIMNKIYTYLDTYRPFSKGKPDALTCDERACNWGLPFIGGFLAVAGFLLLERFLINKYLRNIDKLSSFLVDKVWYSLGRKHIKKRTHRGFVSDFFQFLRSIT